MFAFFPTNPVSHTHDGCEVKPLAIYSADQGGPQEHTINMAPPRTSTQWDHQYNTLRREDLFRNPPTDHSAYPLLQTAVNPHIESFNALFPLDGRRGLISHGLADIGTKTFFDSPANSVGLRNKLTVRYKSVSLQKSLLPPTNKFAKNRKIYPAECRERHATYRGKLTATLEYRINDGEPFEFVRELGNMPIMVKVRTNCCPRISDGF